MDEVLTDDAAGEDSWLAALQEIVLWPLAVASVFAWTLGGAEAQSQAYSAPTADRSLNRIDWATVQKDAAAAGVENVAPGGGLVSFEGRGRASADNLQLPVLLPRSLIEADATETLDAPMELLARTNDYSAEARIEPNSFLISGTRVVFEAPEPATSRIRPIADTLLIERNEYGVAASFERYGAVYTVEIFCALPTADSLCVEDTRVRDLAAEMTFAP